jgi:transcriptional regulator with XRE-family HTH domain
VTKKKKIMKAMTKQQLADRAGVSLNTLNRWMKPLQQQLEDLGMLPGARILPPSIVKFLADRFCIDV